MEESPGWYTERYTPFSRLSSSESNSSRPWVYSTSSTPWETRSSKVAWALVKISWELSENSSPSTKATTSVMAAVWNSTSRV